MVSAFIRNSTTGSVSCLGDFAHRSTSDEKIVIRPSPTTQMKRMPIIVPEREEKEGDS